MPAEEDKKYGVNLKTAMEVHDEASVMQPKVNEFVNKLGGYVYSLLTKVNNNLSGGEYSNNE